MALCQTAHFARSSQRSPSHQERTSSLHRETSPFQETFCRDRAFRRRRAMASPCLSLSVSPSISITPSDSDGDSRSDDSSSEPSSPLPARHLRPGIALKRSSPRPILNKSHSVDVPSTSAEKRTVSFQLPEDRTREKSSPESHRSRMATLAHTLKRLTMAAGASRSSKPEKPQKRILRQPVQHVYLRGASGLPTQRVPLSAVSHSFVRHPSLSSTL